MILIAVRGCTIRFADIGTGIAKKKKGIHGRSREASDHVDEGKFDVQRKAKFSGR